MKELLIRWWLLPLLTSIHGIVKKQVRLALRDILHNKVDIDKSAGYIQMPGLSRDLYSKPSTLQEHIQSAVRIELSRNSYYNGSEIYKEARRNLDKRINSEQFIDDIVARIKQKQL